jgi:hypothetical protein
MVIVFNKSSFPWVFVTVTIFWILISGCATPGQSKKTATLEPVPTEAAFSIGWWYARFRLHWPAEEPVEWHWDLLIANSIIKPVLEQNRDTIQLWRFHRRAARDNVGHQFSLIFYASAETADLIFAALRANELLTDMLRIGIIEKVRYDDPNQNNRPRIEDTSDESWPPVIQRNWPYYIMGASQMWLNLISETIAEMPHLYSSMSLREKEQQYKNANATIDALWEKTGQHAFLHHLSGLFGYRAIVFYDKRMLKF